MKGIVPRLTTLVRKYDPALYVYRNIEGKALVMRESGRPEDSDYGQEELDPSLKNPQIILPLTDNWMLSGKPVEWGIEPILDRLKSMDSWRSDRFLAERKINRERAHEMKQRAERNNFRAMAADLRTEFAQATNEINTSTLEKIDRRRSKDGDCK